MEIGNLRPKLKWNKHFIVQKWKWLSGKEQRGSGGSSLHTASHSMNEAIVASGERRHLGMYLQWIFDAMLSRQKQARITECRYPIVLSE